VHRVFEALEQFGFAAIVGPRRDERREAIAPSRIGVSVGGDVDALSARGSYLEQQRAQAALVAADADAYRLAQMRFRSGVDSYLATLDAQRSLYTAQQGLVTVRQAALGWSRRTSARDRQISGGRRVD